MEDDALTRWMRKADDYWAVRLQAAFGGKTMNLVTVYDCVGARLGNFSIPPGVLMAGYCTGSGDVPWTDAQFSAHPGAVRFDQSPTDTPADETADVLDVEQQAATIADVVPWVAGAWASWHAGKRPGQRTPAVYVEGSELTPVANALAAAGDGGKTSLWLTKPMSQAAAEHLVETAGGPFPIIGVQYDFGQEFDVSVVSKEWLDNVSGTRQNPAPQPGVQTGWLFCRKCQGLFWGPGEQQSVCPRGAQHDGSQSHVYTLGFDR